MNFSSATTLRLNNSPRQGGIQGMKLQKLKCCSVTTVDDFSYCNATNT